MKSDIEILLESQVWKSPSSRLSKLKTLQKCNSKPEALHENPVDAKDSKVLEKCKVIIRPLDLLALGARTETCPAVKIPVFPKLPFGVHSEMLKKEPVFKDAIMSNEQLKKFKLETGRIKRIVKERFLRFSPSCRFLHDKRLSVKSSY